MIDIRDYCIIGSYRYVSGEVRYSVTWLDTGCKSMGFLSLDEAEKNALWAIIRQYPHDSIKNKDKI